MRRTALLGVVGAAALAVGAQGLAGAQEAAGWVGPRSSGQRL